MGYKKLDFSVNHGAVTSTINIAIDLDRRHWQVMRGVKRVIEKMGEEEAKKHFYKSTYLNLTNAEYDCYFMNEIGFSHLMEHLQITNCKEFRKPYEAEFKQAKTETSNELPFVTIESEEEQPSKTYTDNENLVPALDGMLEIQTPKQEDFKEKIAHNLYQQFYDVAEEIEEFELDIYVSSKELINKIKKRNELIKEKQLNHLIKPIDYEQLQKDFEFAGLSVIHE